MGFINLDRNTVESYAVNHFKLFIAMAAGLLIFVGLVAVSIFFVTVRGAEQTMVPDVRGKELTEALLELQQKELYPRISLRYTQSSFDKGLVLEQDPGSGAIVKAGRRINLVISRGVLVNTIEDYRGRNLDDVRLDLRTMFAEAGTSGLATLSLKEPVMYEYSDEEPGIILQQKPEPGSGISGPTTLEFVVSRGPENTVVTIPRFTGLGVSEALTLLGREGLDFVFELRPSLTNETGGTVVYQDPPEETRVSANTPVSLVVNIPPEIPPGELFGLFSYTVPVNPYPLTMRLEALIPGGERTELISVPYRGGNFTVPYQLPEGTVLILSILNRELYRETLVSPNSAGALFPDQL
ncbi:MAG: PASTA domain-containing protein [Treponema sp.]|jgi:beta-lactam-binding protein with PASTA domain|nr:PASTA domain-containing protein [Treponema sp.]